MRRIAIINQKGGVGKTTTSVNLGAALAEQGRRVVIVDLDPQANLSLHLGIEPKSDEPSAYSVLHGGSTFAEALQAMNEPNLRVLPSNIDLSGAELELASAIGRDNLLSDSIEDWVKAHQKETGSDGDPADYVIFDCPPSLGLLSVNALAAASEVIITVQTEFLALMGMSKLVDVVTLIQRRLNPGLKITGIAPCLYDSRLRLAREVLGEIRKYFPGQVFRQPIRSNVKLAEAPSFGTSIIEYAPESNGALDYRKLAIEVMAQESAHPRLAHLPTPKDPTSLTRVRVEDSANPAATTSPAVPRQRPVDRAPVDSPKADAGAATRQDPPKPKPAVANEPAEEREVTLTPKAPPVTSRDSQSAEPKNQAEPAKPPAPQSSSEPARADESVAKKRALPRDAVEEELRVMRSQNLPPLPPEAFEIEG